MTENLRDFWDEDFQGNTERVPIQLVEWGPEHRTAAYLTYVRIEHRIDAEKPFKKDHAGRFLK
jgi:hypothetical protein